MIIHVSIPADEPERVARVIAELWRGESIPFVAPGTFVAKAGDDRGSAIEVYPRGLELIPGVAAVSAQRNPSPSPHSEVHVNIATPLSLDEVLAIATREGWTARLCDRGGEFKLIEFWLENKFQLELMSEYEWKRYRDSLTAAKWLNRSGPPPGSATP
jgi:hypothetical protein